MGPTTSTRDELAPSEAPVSTALLPTSAVIGEDGRLSISGVDLASLAEEFGTPLFVYDEAELRARCAEALAGFGRGVAYATKAFLCLSMAKLASEAGLLLDVSSEGEMQVALHAGVLASSLVLHGNNKSLGELETALRLGVHRLVVDSFDEIDRLASLGKVTGAQRQRVVVRVTPGVEAHTHEYVMTGQEDSKFGFSLAAGDADKAVEALRALEHLELVGVHADIGSQIFDLEPFGLEIAKLAPFLKRHGLGELCVGGGLGVAYLNAEHAPSISEWAAEVKQACQSAGISSNIAVSAEPGRAIVARAGITCYRVGTIKDLAGIRTYLAVDGGMSDNPRPVLYGSGYEAFLPRAADAPRPKAVRIVGKHCESGDVLIGDARLPTDVAVGDILATPVTGAYGYSMASNYNRLGRPAVVFVANGTARIVVRRETVEDLVRLDSLS